MERIGLRREKDIVITRKGFRYSIRRIKPNQWSPKRFWWIVWRMNFTENSCGPTKGVYISIGCGFFAVYRGF